MSLLRRNMSPLYEVTRPSAESKAEALAVTKETLIALRDLMRENDIPATALPTVVEIYAHQLFALCAEADAKLVKARNRKITALVNASRQNDIAKHGRVHAYPGTHDIGLDPEFSYHEMDDAELDAEAKRLGVQF